MKLLGKAGEMPSLAPPDDETIRTLYIGGLDNRVSEQDLRDQFYAHGEIESIRMVIQRACAFVTYTTREGAEKAAEELANKLVIKGVRLKLMWGKPQAQRPDGDDAGRQGHVSHGGLLPRAVISQQHSGDQPQPPGMEGQHQVAPTSHYFNIPAPPGAEQRMYPSMDPQRMGAVVRSQEGDGKPGPQHAGQGQPSSSSGQGYPMRPPAPYYPGGQQYPPYYPPYGGGYMPPPRMPYPPQYPPYQPMLPQSAQPQASSSQQPATPGQQQAQAPPTQQPAAQN
jgi:pre-mRNA-splicing factor RBM22/SLT11